MMRKFRKQSEQVYISSYDYHIVSIWQFDCRNNIYRLSIRDGVIVIGNGAISL